MEIPQEILDIIYSYSNHKTRHRLSRVSKRYNNHCGIICPLVQIRRDHLCKQTRKREKREIMDDETGVKIGSYYSYRSNLKTMDRKFCNVLLNYFKRNGIDPCHRRKITIRQNESDRRVYVIFGLIDAFNARRVDLINCDNYLMISTFTYYLKRRFTLVLDDGKERGYYIGSVPDQAASKALSKIIRRMQIDEWPNHVDVTKPITFILREKTRGSERKHYLYTGYRIKFDNSYTTHVYYHNGIEVEFRYKNVVERI